MRKHRLADAFVVLLFGAGISLPLFQQATGVLPRIEVMDNRALAPPPALDLTPVDIVNFPRQFETWYADHMGLRGLLVSRYRRLTDAMLRSPDRVMIGRDDWLYLRKGVVRGDIRTVPLLRDWCGRSTFTERQLEGWASTIADNHAWLEERGIDYLFVVPPNKITVIPDHLPRRVSCRHGTTRLEQLKDALLQRSGITLVDLRGVLRQAFESGTPVWYRTDTHWNARGVAVAYSALLKQIVALQPGARGIDTFDVSKRGARIGDLGRIVHIDELVPDIRWRVRPASPLSRPAPTPFPNQVDHLERPSSARLVDNPELPAAMVFHDSFFDGPMNELLSESFSHTVFVFHGHPELNRALVERERPDIVIHEMVERSLLHPFYP
jgi:hypothetical protein